MSLSKRLMPVAIVVALLAALFALGTTGLSVFRLWETEQGNALFDPYYFSEVLKRLIIIAVVLSFHFLAVGVCLLVLRNGYARSAAYFFLAGIAAAAVLLLASDWPTMMLREMPKRYIDYSAADFKGGGWVAIIATLVTSLLILAGWARLIAASFHRTQRPAPMRSEP